MAMYLSVAFGSLSGFIFVICVVFSIQDIESVIGSPTGFPLVQVMIDALGLVGGVVLTALSLFNGFGQGISVMTSASRLTWGFARDGGLPWGSYFGHVDRTWHVPARALWLQCFIICLMGVLYLFSNTVLAAVLSVSTIALTISYAIPIAVLLAVGRDKMPPREFSLGRFGTAFNWVSIIYCLITTVSFFFPAAPSPAPADMNWAIGVFAVVLVLSVLFWFVRGRVTYLRTRYAFERALRARQLETETYDGWETDRASDAGTTAEAKGKVL